MTQGSTGSTGDWLRGRPCTLWQLTTFARSGSLLLKAKGHTGCPRSGEATAALPPLRSPRVFKVLSQPRASQEATQYIVNHLSGTRELKQQHSDQPPLLFQFHCQINYMSSGTKLFINLNNCKTLQESVIA